MNYIINPITNKKVNLFIKEGKQILKQYIHQFYGGIGTKTNQRNTKKKIYYSRRRNGTRNRTKYKSKTYIYSKDITPTELKKFIKEYKTDTNLNTCTILPFPKNINNENIKTTDCVLQTLSLLFPLGNSTKDQYNTLMNIRKYLYDLSQQADTDENWTGVSEQEIKTFLQKSHENLFKRYYPSYILHSKKYNNEDKNKIKKTKILKKILDTFALYDNNMGFIIPFTITDHMFFLYYYKENNKYYLKLIDLQVIAVDINCNKCGFEPLKKCKQNLKLNNTDFFSDPDHDSIISISGNNIEELVEYFINKIEKFDKINKTFKKFLNTEWAFFIYKKLIYRNYRNYRNLKTK